MKTSELTGEKLDYWVAHANEEWRNRSHELRAKRNVFGELIVSIGSQEDGWTFWNPSTSWQQGGPIIEREKIALWASGDGFSAAHPSCPDHCYYDVDNGRIDNIGVNDSIVGATPLIAAMRAYVASKYGDEVPDNP